MLTYQIRSPKAARNGNDLPFLDKKAILDRHLDKSWFSVGDRVKFKRPKRSPTKGTITHIEKDWSQVTWTNGGLVPNNISILVDATKGIKPNTTVKTSVKKIIHLAD